METETVWTLFHRSVSQRGEFTDWGIQGRLDGASDRGAGS